MRNTLRGQYQEFEDVLTSYFQIDFLGAVSVELINVALRSNTQCPIRIALFLTRNQTTAQLQSTIVYPLYKRISNTDRTPRSVYVYRAWNPKLIESVI